MYRFARSCNTINDLSNKTCVPNKTEDLNLSTSHMITEINQSKKLTKHISCGCKCVFNETKLESNQLLNNDKYWCEYKKHHIYEKEYVWNPATYNCKIFSKYYGWFSD